MAYEDMLRNRAAQDRAFATRYPMERATANMRASMPGSPMPNTSLVPTGAARQVGGPLVTQGSRALVPQGGRALATIPGPTYTPLPGAPSVPRTGFGMGWLGPAMMTATAADLGSQMAESNAAAGYGMPTDPYGMGANIMAVANGEGTQRQQFSGYTDPMDGKYPGSGTDYNSAPAPAPAPAGPSYVYHPGQYQYPTQPTARPVSRPAYRGPSGPMESRGRVHSGGYGSGSGRYPDMTPVQQEFRQNGGPSPYGMEVRAAADAMHNNFMNPAPAMDPLTAYDVLGPQLYQGGAIPPAPDYMHHTYDLPAVSPMPALPPVEDMVATPVAQPVSTQQFYRGLVGRDRNNWTDAY